MFTYIRIPPCAAETYSKMSHCRLLKIALAVTTVQTRRYQRVAETKRRRLENVRHARMHFLPVAGVLRQLSTQKRRQILVHYDILQLPSNKHNNQSSSSSAR